MPKVTQTHLGLPRCCCYRHSKEEPAGGLGLGLGCSPSPIPTSLLAKRP